MRIGLFCTYENPSQDYRSAYAEQTELVEFVEALGYDEAWVAEHHFNATATSASPFSILAHLAARTSRLRLGTAAVLLPFRDPILVAEDVATLDILSGGRFDFGIAKGGPFPVQNKHFHVAKEESRARTCESLALIEKLLSDNKVSFEGRFFKADGIELVPKPVQRPVPIYFATSTPETIRLSAERGYGLMAAPAFPLAAVGDSLQLYRAMAPECDPRLIMIRFYHLAATTADAVAEAKIFLQPFIDRMRMTITKVQPEWVSWMALERLIADSLVGSPQDICEKISGITREYKPRSLILKPLSPQFLKRKEDLHVFAEKIRPAAMP